MNTDCFKKNTTSIIMNNMGDNITSKFIAIDIHAKVIPYSFPSLFEISLKAKKTIGRPIIGKYENKRE